MSDKGKRRRSASASSTESAPSKKAQKMGTSRNGSSRVMKMLTKLVQEGKAREETEVGLSSGKKNKKAKPGKASSKSGSDAGQALVVPVFKAGTVVVLNCGLQALTVSGAQQKMLIMLTTLKDNRKRNYSKLLELRERKMPSKIQVQILQAEKLARMDSAHPFEVHPDDAWESIQAKLFEWLPELGQFLQARVLDTLDANPAYQEGDTPSRQFLPQLVLCSKDCSTVSVIPYVDFPNGGQVMHFSSNRQKNGIANTTIIFGNLTHVI